MFYLGGIESAYEDVGGRPCKRWYSGDVILSGLGENGYGRRKGGYYGKFSLGVGTFFQNMGEIKNAIAGGRIGNDIGEIDARIKSRLLGRLSSSRRRAVQLLNRF